MSGIMLGIFIFRTLPQSTAPDWSYRALAAFVMIGFCILLWIDKLGRVLRAGGLSPEEANESLQTEHLIDPNRVQLTEYYESSNVASDQYGADLHILAVENKVLSRRRRNAVLLYALFCFICIIEGLYLVYRQDVALGGPGGTVACFYVDKLMESLVIGAILVYACFHALATPRWYIALCTLWCIVIIMSTVPVLNATTAATIAVAVEHPALSIIYAIAAGFIFYISIYFIFINRAQTDRRDMVLRLVSFTLGAWIPFVTSMFM